MKRRACFLLCPQRRRSKNQKQILRFTQDDAAWIVCCTSRHPCFFLPPTFPVAPLGKLRAGSSALIAPFRSIGVIRIRQRGRDSKVSDIKRGRPNQSLPACFALRARRRTTTAARRVTIMEQRTMFVAGVCRNIAGRGISISDMGITPNVCLWQNLMPL